MSVTDKRCPRCEKTKPISEFGTNKTRKDGLAGYCKECSHELYKGYRRTFFDRHPDAHRTAYYKHKDEALRYNKTYRESRLELLWSLKTPCVKCGEDRKCSIHFHHIDPTAKTRELSHGSIGKAKIVEEVKKCVCLCANCHEEFHYLYGHQPTNPVEALVEYLGGKTNA